MVKLNDLQKHEIKDWSNEVEETLGTFSEKAQIWRLLHMKNHNIFKRKYYCLIIPVTILSSITGAANLALGSVANGQETVINLIIGALGILVSVISTLNNIFSFQKRKDEHYRAAKDWYRVQRMIDVELSLQKSKRNNVSVFFHLVLQEIERIHESHPNVRDDVIRTFMKNYKNKKISIDIPEILTIRKTLIFKDESISPSNNNTYINNDYLSTIIDKPNVNNDINNQKINPINKKPSYNKQGTFIIMNDDTDRTSSESDKSDKSDKSDIIIENSLNSETQDIHISPENILKKEEKRHSFLYNIGDSLKYVIEQQTKKENSKSVSSNIYNLNSINNTPDIGESKRHNNSSNVSPLIIPEESDIKIEMSDKTNDNSETERYAFEINDKEDRENYINNNDNKV